MASTEPTRFTMAAGEAAPGVRSFAWPVLQRGDMSFPNGVYGVEIEPSPDRRSFRISHRVDGAPLIRRLLAEGRARYACSIASPNASYRHLETSTASTYRVGWDLDELGAPPIFMPMVVGTREFTDTLDAERDGVADLWHGKTIRLPSGAKLAA